jgi:hypothetical protein
MPSTKYSINQSYQMQYIETIKAEQGAYPNTLIHPPPHKPPTPPTFARISQSTLKNLEGTPST